MADLDAKTLRRKDDKSGTEAICRHSERLAYHKGILPRTARLLAYDVSKESSLLQYKAAAKNENNSTETDHASMPLYIFASKSVSCRHSVLELLLARNCHSYCCRRYELRSSLPELATRPQFRNADLHLAAWLPSCLAAKRVAFTLAEVLITLGIIGIVAALTLPSVIQNYRKQVILNKIKRTYAVLNNTIERAKADYGTNVNEWYIPSGDDRTKSMYFVENYMLPYLNILEYCKDQSLKQICKEAVDYFNTTYEIIGPVTSDYGTNFILTDGTNVYVHVGRMNASESMDTKRIMVDFDIDGVNSGKNTYGYDVFRVELGGDEGYNLKNNADKNKFLPYTYIPSEPCDYYVGTQPHSCNKEAIYGGSSCLAYIVCNGWSFGDKYPW